jgi:hypothetical protein
LAEMPNNLRLTFDDLRQLGRDHARQIFDGYRKLLDDGQKIDIDATIGPKIEQLKAIGCTDEEIEIWMQALEATLSPLLEARAPVASADADFLEASVAALLAKAPPRTTHEVRRLLRRGGLPARSSDSLWE